MRSFWNFLSGMLLGAAIGAVTALILAPESGDQLRKDIRREIDEILNEGRRAASDRRSELEDQLARLRRDG
jgi:gas vesicle protein